MLPSVRYAARQVRKNAGFALTAAMTLGVGIGATTAIFSVVNAVLLRPLPFPQQDRLAWIQYDDSELGGDGSDTFSYPNFFDYRARQHSFSAIASYRNSSKTLIGVGDARQLRAQIVSADFFRVLGVAPFAGRDFSPMDEKRNVRTVMLSWDLWQRVFGGRRDIVGGAIDLDGNPYEVAGVMPAGVSFPIQSPPPELWISLAQDAGGRGSLAEQRGAGVLNLIGRLKPSITLAEARADFQVIAGNLAAEYPKDNRQLTRIIMAPELEHLVGNTRPAIRVLFGAVMAVLLIACVNVAGLLLARASRRNSEIALLTALGAGRGAILRQVLLESIFLALAGGAIGILLSAWGLEALRRFLPSSIPRGEQISIDVSVLIFAIVVSVATGILFGLLPAWKTSRVDPIGALRDAGRGIAGNHFRLQSWLIVAETAIGLVLLVGSGLLIRSFLRVLAIQPGFDARNVLTLNLSVPDTRYPHDAQIRLYEELMPRLAALPGVKSAAAAWPMPLSGNDVNIGFEIPGRPVQPGAEPVEHLSVATPGFFRTMGIRVLAGREFVPADGVKAPAVMIVNEAFARKYFPGEPAVGKHVKPGIGDGTHNAAVREIVGVVDNVKRAGLTVEADPQYYLPWEQALITWPTIAIRSAGSPATLTGAISAAVAGIDRSIPVYKVATLEEIVSKAAAAPRFETILLAVFAAIAMFLAAVGLYAVLAYMVGERAREIGVRVALGARRTDVAVLVLRRGLTLAGAGVALGLAVSVLLTRQMTGMLYGVRPLDPLTLLSVSAILLAVSALASVGPAYGAARLDPMRVLGKE